MRRVSGLEHLCSAERVSAESLYGPDGGTAETEALSGANSGAFCGKSRVIGLFAEKDELLGTQFFESFGKYCGEARLMPGGHHGNREAISVIVKTVEQMIEI